MISNEFDFMRMAVEAARKCVPEDARISPKVGAVVVKDGEVQATAFRGEIESGEHAEYTALEKKLRYEVLAGCTVYTTLEPCTDRNPPKLSCSEHLKDRKVARVVIGMLDPNQSIRGNGILLLRKAGIEVGFFPHDLMAELEELNRDFIRDQEQKASSLYSNKKNHIIDFFFSKDLLSYPADTVEQEQIKCVACRYFFSYHKNYLLRLLEEEKWEALRMAVVGVLGQLIVKEALPMLHQIVSETQSPHSSLLFSSALNAIKTIKDTSSLPILLDAKKNKNLDYTQIQIINDAILKII